MKKLLLVPLLFGVLLISNCNKQSKSADENNTDVITEKLRTNADYRSLIANSNDVRNEIFRILQPMIQDKKVKKLSELPADLQQSLRKQLAENKLIQSYKSSLKSITGAIPELKNLSRPDFVNVLAQARQMVKKELNLKLSLTGLHTARINSDHPCEDSCDAIYGSFYESVEESHTYAIVNCRAHETICELGCSNDPCKYACQLAGEACEADADEDYWNAAVEISHMVADCYDSCIPDPTE